MTSGGVIVKEDGSYVRKLIKKSPAFARLGRDVNAKKLDKDFYDAFIEVMRN